jgi:quercetin dioxygenase-like cupin family protein
MEIYNWNSLPAEKMSPLLIRQVIHTPYLTISRLQLAKGAIVPLHHHVHEQVTTLQSGVLRFELGGDEIVIRAGDVLRIPSGVPHSVETLEDSVAVDLFTPPREDWIRGDDAYLRK